MAARQVTTGITRPSYLTLPIRVTNLVILAGYRSELRYTVLGRRLRGDRPAAATCYGDIRHEHARDSWNHQKAANRRHEHTADHHAGQRLLDLRADAGRDRGGDKSDAGGKASHEYL